jgi:hypothetical protein
MSLKRLLFFLCMAFAVFFVITKPAAAAHFVKEAGESLGQWMETAASSLIKFFKSLV